MTNIVNFEENIKSNERPTNVLLDMIENYSLSKLSGVPQADALAKIEILLARLHANKIRNGKETDAKAYEDLMPKVNVFSSNNTGLDVAREYAIQADAAAQFDRESRYSAVR